MTARTHIKIEAYLFFSKSKVRITSFSIAYA